MAVCLIQCILGVFCFEVSLIAMPIVGRGCSSLGSGWGQSCRELGQRPVSLQRGRGHSSDR